MKSGALRQLPERDALPSHRGRDSFSRGHSSFVPSRGTHVNDPDWSVPTHGTQVRDTIDLVPADPDHAFLSRGYVEMLLKAYDGLPHGMAKAIGINRKDIHYAKGGAKISLSAIDELRLLLNEHDPEAQLPPPIVKVESREQFAWFELGRRLLAASPSTFEEMLAKIEKIVTGAEAQHDLGLSGDE